MAVQVPTPDQMREVASDIGMSFTLTGVVGELRWENPHASLQLVVGEKRRVGSFC